MLFKIIVFLTGASVLVIEVTATRILSPYFGNTIFTFSSVISVILTALSLGYYFGGRLSDKNPSKQLFFSIITLSGLALLIFHLLGKTFLLGIYAFLNLTSGPLVASLFLFFLPAFLLGTLSPFAVKLQSINLSNEEKGIGSIS